jgi:hypothetical protein
MVPVVVADAVQGTLLYRAMAGPYAAASPLEGARGILSGVGLVEYGQSGWSLTAEGRTILTALSQASGLRVAEWLAEKLGPLMRTADCEPGVCPAWETCSSHVVDHCATALLAEACAAVGAEPPGPSVQECIDDLADHDITLWPGTSNQSLPYFNLASGYGPCYRCANMERNETWEQFVRRAWQEIKGRDYQPLSRAVVGTMTEAPTPQPSDTVLLDALNDEVMHLHNRADGWGGTSQDDDATDLPEGHAHLRDLARAILAARKGGTGHADH